MAGSRKAQVAGVRTLDSDTQTVYPAFGLTGLSLTGDTLTCEHSGTLWRAQLHERDEGALLRRLG